MSKGEIAYLDEIVEELSKEFGIGFEEMKEICTLSLDYIKYLTKVKETLSVLLPSIGVFYYNRKIGNFYLTRLAKNRKEKNLEEIECLEYRQALIEEKRSSEGSRVLKHTQRPFLYKFKSILKKLGKGIPKGGATLGHKELWAEVSSIQNSINNVG